MSDSVAFRAPADRADTAGPFRPRPHAPGPCGRIALINARLLDPATGFDGPGGVLIEDGRIAAVGVELFPTGLFGEEPPSDVTAIDCRGACLAPALVDLRAELREPGGEYEETIDTAAMAAVAGGVARAVAMPNTDPVIDDVSLVETINRRAREVGLAHIHPAAALTKGRLGRQITEMGLMAEAGAVAFTDAPDAISDALAMRRGLSYARTFDLLVMQHPEERRLAEGGDMNEGELAMRLGLAGIPTAAETIMVERDIHLVRLTGARYHVGPLSTASAIEAVRRAKDEGLAVTCHTAPHYFALNEIAVGEYRTFAKVSPPLRSEEDRRAVIRGLAEGVIDAIASNHAPHDPDSKRQPFSQASFGAIGLETLLPITLNLTHSGELDLLSAIRALATAPAEIVRLPGGSLAKGEPAHIVQFDPVAAWRIDPHALYSKSKNTPFDGHPVQGRAIRTIVGGHIVFDRTERAVQTAG